MNDYYIWHLVNILNSEHSVQQNLFFKLEKFQKFL